MSMIGFPLLLIPLAIYNIIVFLMPGTPLTASLFAVPLMSGVVWSVALGDILLGVGILMLMFEVMKGARPGGKYLTDHLLALLVLGGAAAEFVLLPQFGNSTFALLTALALVDFISGLSLRARRPRVVPAATIAREEDLAVRRKEIAPERSEARVEPTIEKAEPRIESPSAYPVPSHSPSQVPSHVPSAAPLAESILSDAPAPVAPATQGPIQQPTAPTPSPVVTPLGLQPANHNEPPAR